MQLRVSRTSVREALIALEIEGLIEVRGGSGIYVAPAGAIARPLFDVSDSGPGPFELLRARRVVEGEIAALAARSIDAKGLHTLEHSIEIYRSRVDDASAREDADRTFHLCIAEVANNSVLLQTIRLYMDQRRSPMWWRIVEHFQTDALLDGVVSDHYAIVDALGSRKPAAARAAMHQHLDRVEKQFAKGWKKEMPEMTIPTKVPTASRRFYQRNRRRATP